MSASPREIEIKLPFATAEDAREKLAALGARVIQPRTFEENVLFDRESPSLAAAGRLLRVRRYGAVSRLTYKQPIEGASTRHKIRREDETGVDDPAATERILVALGFRPTYRYQKYRTVLRLGDGGGTLEVCVDETPLGCFVELEGAPESIDRTAARLGFDVADYVVASYRELHEADAARRGEAIGDLVFENREAQR